MKAAKISVLRRASKAFASLLTVAAVTFALGAAGCGSDGTQTNQTSDLANFLPAPTLDFATLVCISSCATNAQCQNSCPPPTSGTACCDTATNTCFTAQATSCPAPADMSTPVAPY